MCAASQAAKEPKQLAHAGTPSPSAGPAAVPRLPTFHESAVAMGLGEEVAAELPAAATVPAVEGPRQGHGAPVSLSQISPCGAHSLGTETGQGQVEPRFKTRV